MQTLDELFEQFWKHQKIAENVAPGADVAKIKETTKTIWLSAYLTCFAELTVSVPKMSDSKAEAYLMVRQSEMMRIISKYGVATCDGGVIPPSSFPPKDLTRN